MGGILAVHSQNGCCKFMLCRMEAEDHKNVQKCPSTFDSFIRHVYYTCNNDCRPQDYHFFNKTKRYTDE